MSTSQLAAFRWWDSLSIGKQALYGSQFPECKNSGELIKKAYEEYQVKNKTHLHLVK